MSARLDQIRKELFGSFLTVIIQSSFSIPPFCPRLNIKDVRAGGKEVI